MKALVNPNIFHGAVESSFEGERKRNLWRIDKLNGKQYILLLSEDKPNLESFSNQFGISGDYQTKDYTAFLKRIEQGGRWRFRLTANPTIRKTRNNGGKTFAHITPEFQKKWLIERAEKNGFSLNETEFEPVQSSWYRFYKNECKRPVSILSVSFEGILTITDAELFKKTLCDGIGREKAYGMGLLTIVSI